MKKTSILLIALMVVSVGFLSGCNEQKSNTDQAYEETTVENIENHLDDYVGKTVTIRGCCYGYNVSRPYAVHDTAQGIMYAINTANLNDSTIHDGNEYAYKFIGIIREGDVPGSEYITCEYYIEVTKIESI